MRAGLLGTGVALETAAAQLRSESSVDVEGITTEAIESVDIAVVAGAVGEGTIAEASEAAVSAGIPLVAIELGGIGGLDARDVDATIARLGPAGPCFSCLRQRLASTEPPTGDERAPSARLERIAGAHAGAIAAEALAGEGDGGHLLTFPYRERTLLPVTGCPTCGSSGDRWAPPDGGEPRPLESAIEAAEHALDDLVGPVTEIGEAASHPLPYYLASTADTSAFSDASAPSHAAGVAEDWNLAFMKGIGEALERYAAGTYRTETFTRGTPGEVEEMLDLASCVRPSGAEAIDEPIPWVPAATLVDGETRWLPADLVVFPPPERIVRPAITSGLALGNTPEEAALAGLVEVIERDATMLAWYSTFEPVELTVEDPTVTRLVRFAGLVDLEVTLTLLTQDVDIPVVGAFVQREGDFPRFAAGSAADFDPVAAAADALREAIQNWMELAEMGEDAAEAESPRLQRYADDPSPLDRLLSPPVSVAADEVGGDLPDTPSQELSMLVDAVSDVGMDPAVAWLTPRDLAQLGFVAARVVVPSAQPLLLSSPYFGERAETVPEGLGFEARLDREPHPFP